MILKTNEKEKQGQQEKNIIGYYKRQWLSQIKCIFQQVTQSSHWEKKWVLPLGKETKLWLFTPKSSTLQGNRKLAGAKVTYLESRDIDTADC